MPIARRASFGSCTVAASEEGWHRTATMEMSMPPTARAASARTALSRGSRTSAWMMVARG